MYASGLTAFDYMMTGAAVDRTKPAKDERDTAAASEEVARYVRAEILPLVNQALYACARSKPADKSPCTFVAEYLLEHHAAYQPQPNMMLPHGDLVFESTDENITKPLGVSSLEAMIALELFRKFDVDRNEVLEVEQLTLVLLRMGERIAGRPVPDTSVLRAVKTVMSEVALNSADSVVGREDLINCLDRVCPVFRSFKGQLDTESYQIESREAYEVVEDLYHIYDLNEDQILTPDEIFLLLRRACDCSAHKVGDIECMELFSLLMEHAMLDKDDDDLLDKEEVKDAFELVFKFYNQRKGYTAPKARPAAAANKSRFKATLLNVYDRLDEDSCGLAARLELKRELTELYESEIESFIVKVASSSSMLIDRSHQISTSNNHHPSL